MMRPLVSIITPTYNHEKFIETCIISVINQSYKNWEMIIIDDCSTDSTHRIAKKYASRDKRIKLFKHKKRWGIKRLKDSYNQALKIVKGDLIAILEGDDFWPTYKLEVQIKDFQKNETILSYGDCIAVDGNDTPFEIREKYNKAKISWLNNAPVGSILYVFSDLSFFLDPCTVLVKRTALNRIGGFVSGSPYPFVDIPTWIALSLQGGFKYNRKILGYYRKHYKSAWFDFAKKTNAMGRNEIQKFLFSFLKKNRKILKTNSIDIDYRKIRLEQERFIRSKANRKKWSLILHSVIFNDIKAAKIGIKLVLEEKNEKTLTKIKGLVLLMSLPLKSKIMGILFYAQLLQYNIRNLLDRGREKWDNTDNIL